MEIQENTETKKFKSYPTPFSTRNGAFSAFDRIFSKFKNSILIVSYSSNSLPTKDEMIALMKKYKANVEVIPIDYQFSEPDLGDDVVLKPFNKDFKAMRFSSLHASELKPIAEFKRVVR